MNTVDKYFLQQGKTIQLYVDCFLQNDIDDVLDYSFNIEVYEKYLFKKSESIRNKILDLMKNKKKYIFIETGETFEINDDLLEYELNFKGDLSKFKRYLKKATVKELVGYEKIFFENNLIIKK